MKKEAINSHQDIKAEAAKQVRDSCYHSTLKLFHSLRSLASFFFFSILLSPFTSSEPALM